VDVGLLVFIMLASLTPLVVVVFLVVVLLRVVVAVLVPKRPPSMPRCGSCGYLTEGLNEDRCPECGGTFAKVGIQRHRSPAQRVDGVIRAFFPVVVWMIATVLLLGGIGNVAPRPAVETDTFSLPPSGTYTGVAVTKRGSRPALVTGGPMQPTALVFEMIGDHAGGGALTVTFPERRWQLSAADGEILEHGRGADPASVTALFNVHGVSTEPPEIQREITAKSRSADTARRGSSRGDRRR
jgi:hypothetical protein